MSVEIFNLPQGSPEWFAVRKGIPTASRFATVMAKGSGATRAAYMATLANEVLTGNPSEPSFQNKHTARGHDVEPIIRNLFAETRKLEPVQVGFIRNCWMGASPDALVGANSGLEIKSALETIQHERILKNRLPPEYRAQVQGNMLVAERDHWHFVSGCIDGDTGLPVGPLLIVDVARDDRYIAKMREEIDRFNDELAELVEGRRRGSIDDLQACLDAADAA
jgi:putative phage-type endonuclease